MRETFRRWWPVLRALLMLAILVGVALQFHRVLRSEELQQTDTTRSPGQILWDAAATAHPAGLAASALLYVGGLWFHAILWLWVMRALGQPLGQLAAYRAYYVSHLGKYSPVKGTALILRTSLAVECGARPGVAALTAAYETLVGMAAGALLSAALIAGLMADSAEYLGAALVLLVLAGVPILPGVFNRVVLRLADRFRQADADPLPRLDHRILLAGLALTGCGWLTLGASLEAFLQALSAEPRPWTVEGWLRGTAYVALAWVAGFVISTPGGLGVREFVLHRFLLPDLGPTNAIVAVVLLRVHWTLTEFVVAGLMYWLPVRPQPAPGAGKGAI